MAAILKSLALALLGAALFFCFFMLASAPLLIILARLHHESGVYLSPVPLYRAVGLPLSTIAFAACFVMGIRKFRGPASRQPASTRR